MNAAPRKHNALLVGASIAVPLVLLAAYAGRRRRHPIGNRAVPQPAKSVDLSRYTGLWHEIARYEQSFQKDCDVVTATYESMPDGRISIVNACRQPDGTPRRAAAKAYVLPGSENAKLKVSFFGPFYVGNYWVLDHADDYSWSIVGDPSGRYLWLLARAPNPSSEEKQALARRAEALGYDTSMLRWTAQP